VDALGDAPDFHAMPVGNAGNITAYWKGYTEYRQAGRATRAPRMLGFQAAGAAPLVDGAPVAHPETIATAIRIGNPASWASAIRARDESGGRIDKVTDGQILDAYQALAQTEGVFVEPACAAPIAGLKQLASSGYFNQAPGSPAAPTITVTLTGHGLKDPDRAIATAGLAVGEVAATREAVLAALSNNGTEHGTSGEPVPVAVRRELVVGVTARS
jgi:threonine synthase